MTGEGWRLPAACAKAAERLPQLSPAHAKIINSPEAELGQIALWIDSDPALCSYVLRVANSSFYGLSHSVGSSADAVVVIGRSATAAICAAGLVRALCPLPGHGDFDSGEFWRRSVMVGCLASAAAERLGEREDHAFCAGLLHDIGSLVAWVSGGSHGASIEELGSGLASSWGFPPNLCQAIAESGGSAGAGSLGLAVAFGRRRAKMLMASGDADGGKEFPSEGKVGEPGPDPDADATLFENEVDFEGALRKATCSYELLVSQFAT